MQNIENAAWAPSNHASHLHRAGLGHEVGHAGLRPLACCGRVGLGSPNFTDSSGWANSELLSALQRGPAEGPTACSCHPHPTRQSLHARRTAAWHPACIQARCSQHSSPTLRLPLLRGVELESSGRVTTADRRLCHSSRKWRSPGAHAQDAAPAQTHVAWVCLLWSVCASRKRSARLHRRDERTGVSQC